MKLEKDTSGIDRVVETATKYVNTADKVVGLIQNAGELGKKVGDMKTSTKIGLLLGGVLVLSLFPLRLAYDSKTGEGEYKSLLVGVKRTQRPVRATSDRTHDVSLEMFPTVRPKPSDIKPCDLPPAQKREPIKAQPMQVCRVQKARCCVPVKLCVQEDETCLR